MITRYKKTILHVALSLVVLTAWVPHYVAPIQLAHAQEEGGEGGPMGMLGQFFQGLMGMMMLSQLMKNQQPQPAVAQAPANTLTQDQKQRYEDAIKNLQERLAKIESAKS